MSERGMQMAQSIQRIGGYNAPAGMSWPDAENDPEPLEEFVETEEVEEVEEPIEPIVLEGFIDEGD